MKTPAPASRPVAQRIRLLLLIPHLGGGGAERVTALLASHLPPERYEIHLALVTVSPEGHDRIPPSVRVHRLRAPRVRRAWFSLLRLIWRVRPHVILSGIFHLNFLILALKPLLPRKTRLLVRQNSTATASATAGARAGYRLLYPRAHAVICQSQPMAVDLEANFRLPRERLRVLANPVDIASIRSASTPSPSTEPWPLLLVVCRLSHEKGIDLLILAMAAVRLRHPAARLMILGTGPEQLNHLRLIRELDLEDSVILAGHRADPTPWYHRATLFVLPSRHEGMPNALLEAAAAGLPIVATPCCGGVCELLQHAPGTWLASAITSEALTHSILAALATMTAAQVHPRRFEHAFLAPFELPAAIRAWDNLFCELTP